MKKIVSITLVVLLIFSASLNVFAEGNSCKVKYVNKKVVKQWNTSKYNKKFNDITNYNWAENAIERMALKGVIKGYGQGKFQPKKSVTKLESIIMALRVMGYEEDAKINLQRIRNGEKKLKNKAYFQEWAYGYVAVAIEKGILDEVDLLEFGLNKPAKRHEVSKYIIRALGFEDEALDHMKDELRFIDAGAIPLGSVGYVYLSDEKGLIKGYPDGTFRPNKSVTRAEMAVLIARLDDKVDSDIDDMEKYAEVVKVGNDEIVLKIDNKNKEYEVVDNAPVYKDGKYVSLDDVVKGTKVVVQFNDSGEIIFIEIKSADEVNKIIKRFEGTIKDVDDDELVIKMQTMTIAFEIANDIEVLFNGDEGEIDDLEDGDEVIVIVDDKNRAKTIKVDRDIEGIDIVTELEGELITVYEDVYDDDKSYITIKSDDVLETFYLDEDVEVYIDGDKEELEDLENGDEVEIEIIEDIVEKIKTYR